MNRNQLGDYPVCFDPSQSWFGTQADNMADCARKRKPNRAKKLDRERVAQIKVQLGEGQKHRVIAAQYNVTRSNISQIAQGRIWRDVQPALGQAADAEPPVAA
jgi:hypothetical protein